MDSHVVYITIVGSDGNTPDLYMITVVTATSLPMSVDSVATSYLH